MSPEGAEPQVASNGQANILYAISATIGVWMGEWEAKLESTLEREHLYIIKKSSDNFTVKSMEMLS